MKNRNEIKSTSMDWDVGLGSKMQAGSSEFEKTSWAFLFNQYQFGSACNSSNTTPSAAGGGRGGGPFLWDISSIQACGTGDIYAAGTPVLPTTLDSSRFGASGGGGGRRMAASERSLFTASQLHELERQQIIHMYMMASVPVPHELMLHISRTSSFAAASLSKTSGSGMDSRFSSSKSDPEPWRCRRTDGKKWRCSRIAAADHRYCERHSHKNKPRSRKHVEAKNSPQAPPTSHFPEMAPGLGALPYDQASIKWCMRGGSSGTTVPVSTCNYRQQMQQTSSRLDLMNTDNTHHQTNVSQSQTLHRQDFRTPVPGRFEFSNGEYSGSILPSKMASFQENLSLDLNTHTTPPLHFWEQESIKGLSPSSLTLAMSSNRNDEGNQNSHHFGIGMSISQRNSPPGGPLGEALCLGYASSSNLVSPNDDTYTSNSCEDGRHAFNFIS